MWGKVRRKKKITSIINKLKSEAAGRGRTGTGTQNFAGIVVRGARSLPLANSLPILIKLLQK